MKKKPLIVATLFLMSILSYAQKPNMDTSKTVLSKKGHEILPRKGDIALGFNAVPVVDFLLTSMRYVSLVGSSSTGSITAASSVAGTAVQYTANFNNQIVGKYFLDAKTAIRVRFGYNTEAGNVNNPVQDDAALYAANLSGTPDAILAAQLMKVDDKLTFSKSSVLLSVGLEKRRGYRRLQGYYGGEFGVGFTNANQSVAYGNAFSELYPVDYTNYSANPAGGISMTAASENPATIGTGNVTRNLETDWGATWTFGLRGFIGVEYFVFPKISVGVEYGWGYSITTSRQETKKDEIYFNGQNGPTDVVQKYTVNSVTTNRGFVVDQNNPTQPSFLSPLGNTTNLQGGTGSIILLFHF